MSEKEINEIVEEHYGFTVEEIDNMVGNLSLRVSQLEYNNKKLKERIDKAIEYINKIELDNYDIYIANILLDRDSDLLEILKGNNEVSNDNY